MGPNNENERTLPARSCLLRIKVKAEPVRLQDAGCFTRSWSMREGRVPQLKRPESQAEEATGKTLLLRDSIFRPKKRVLITGSSSVVDCHRTNTMCCLEQAELSEPEFRGETA
jgi:hypothetical protein